MGNRLLSAQKLTVSRCKQHFLTATAKLDAMSPLKVLTRGYAMAQNGDGSVIRSIQQVTTGEHLHILLSDGSVETQVVGVKENKL